MRRYIQQTVVLLLIFSTTFAPTSSVFARGGRGGGGGGGRVGGGGGGGARMGGGGMSRPSPSISRSPSMSRPSAPSRPSGGVASRPSTRPSTPNFNRPSSPGLSPGSRPGSVDFARPSTLPSNRPGLTPGTRPSIGDGPRVSEFPGTRPGAGNSGIGSRPSVGTLPSNGIGNAGRPGAGSGITNRPGLPGAAAGAGAALLPGLGNRPNIGERPSQLPSRGTAQERRGDLENRLSQRQDSRGERVEDRMANRDEVREDWQDRYGNIYDRHDDWHHGCWNGNAGEWWNHMWEDHTALMAFGTTMWGLNRAAYAFGYWGYENPYYSEPYPISEGYAIDYSQPIAVDSQPAAPATTTGEPPAAAPGTDDFNAARDAFYKKDYSGALASCNKALTALPNDPIIHEFRSLVLFAQGKYREAAAGLYSVLSVGPGWDWTTLLSLYPDQETYTAQFRKLEDYVKQNPKASDAKFVLAYHYITTGNKTAATKQLQTLYKANPQDNLVKQLLLMNGGPEALGEPSTTPAPSESPAATIPAADLVGKWSAEAQGNKFVLELTKDGNFVWSFSQGTQVQTVKGVYALDGDTLAMEPDAGGTMLAQLTPPQGGSFHFQMLGAPPDDAGLKFAKSK